MKVLFVCNNAYTRGNGLCTSVQNTIKKLREHGVDARLMAIRNPDSAGPQPDFPLGHFKFPIFEPIIYANGFSYAAIDRRQIRKAVEWADIVHFEEVFFLQEAVMRVARSMGKACTATFHLYPHNITANLGLRKSSMVNDVLIRNWNSLIFRYCSDIQCPTPEVRKYLETSGVKSRLHVISNGIQIPAEPLKVQPVEAGEVIDILCVGRLSREKSQRSLLEAMRHSRNAGRIRLLFAGNGPKARKYRRLADQLYKEGVLKIKPEFGFYTHEELAALARRSYLYVHCAYVEVEGLSCLESMCEGLVPVIADGALIGTTEFARCPESVYPVGDSKALAERIDWWIEHPAERNRMSQVYADAARGYDIDKSMEALIDMYSQALNSR